MNWIKRQFKKIKTWVVVAILGATTLAFNLPPQGAVNDKPMGWDEPVQQGEESMFAEIDENGNVLRVIVIDIEDLMTGQWGDPTKWVRTYADGGKRGYMAGKGLKYDSNLDAFTVDKPYNSWTFDSQDKQWKAPKARPTDRINEWDETKQSWK